jgi:hypothetical protein
MAGKWKQRVFTLFNQHPSIPLALMGMPPGLQAHPLSV